MNTLIRAANAAALEPTARNAVTGVGAPSYTSGDHIWNGTAEILKPKPATRKTIPTTIAGDRLPISASFTATSEITVVPVIPYTRLKP